MYTHSLMNFNIIRLGHESAPFPQMVFRWLEKHEIDQLFVKIMELGVNDEKGYILEVDLEMPKDKT